MSGNASTETVEASSPVPLTMDDFVIMSTTDFVTIRRTTTLKYKGRFNSYLWFVDVNNTRYLYVPYTRQQVSKQLNDQLTNNSDGESICVDKICFNREDAENALETMNARAEYRLLPNLIPQFAIAVVVFSVVIAVGITANLLIISGILTSSHLRNSTGVLICSLAISDVLVLLFAPTAQVMVKFFSNYNIWNLEFCRTLYYIKNFSIVISSYNMAAMSVERYIAICHPLRAKSYCTVQNARNAVIVVWIVAMATCIPVVFFVKGSENGSFCLLLGSKDEIMAYNVAVLVCVFGIPMFVMAPMYWKIFIVLWKSSKTSQAMKNAQASAANSGEENESVKMRKQAIVMLMTVLLAFVLCWGPAAIYEVIFRAVLNNYGVVWPWGPDVSVALNSLGFCNSCFNPLICIKMSRKFREYVMSVLCCSRKTDKKAALWTKDSRSSQSGTSVTTAATETAS